MYPMSMSAANQLASDRRVAREATADRHRRRRLFSRRSSTATVESPLPSPALLVRPVLVPIAGSGEPETTSRPERTVA